MKKNEICIYQLCEICDTLIEIVQDVNRYPHIKVKVDQQKKYKFVY